MLPWLIVQVGRVGQGVLGVAGVKIPPPRPPRNLYVNAYIGLPALPRWPSSAPLQLGLVAKPATPSPSCLVDIQ